jgi:hypothetical protein
VACSAEGADVEVEELNGHILQSVEHRRSDEKLISPESHSGY